MSVAALMNDVMAGSQFLPSARGTGLGRRCLTHLTRELLLHAAPKVCLLANEENPAAHSFYRMCGFRQRGVYDTIFLSLD